MILLVLYATMVAEEYSTLRSIPKIYQFNDLAKDDSIDFGTVSGGSTLRYFQVMCRKNLTGVYYTA
jgi:hypothetical protein